MKDDEGNKYYTDKEKCNLLGKTWKDIFTITDQEEATFDTVHSEHINTYVNIQQHRMKPFPTVELNRRNNGNYRTRLIDIAEIKRFIKKIQKKAPGDSKIISKY